MAKKRTNVTALPRDSEDLRLQRLELIKKRHRELILKPRAGLMDGLLDDDDALHSLEDPEEYQLIEEYDFQPEF